MPCKSRWPSRARPAHGGPKSPELLPILFQNHGTPVRFRNIWLVVNSRATGQYDSGLPFNTYQQPGSSVFDNVHLPQRHGFYWTGKLTPPSSRSATFRRRLTTRPLAPEDAADVAFHSGQRVGPVCFLGARRHAFAHLDVVAIARCGRRAVAAAGRVAQSLDHRSGPR